MLAPTELLSSHKCLCSFHPNNNLVPCTLLLHISLKIGNPVMPQAGHAHFRKFLLLFTIVSLSANHSMMKPVYPFSRSDYSEKVTERGGKGENGDRNVVSAYPV